MQYDALSQSYKVKIIFKKVHVTVIELIEDENS